MLPYTVYIHNITMKQNCQLKTVSVNKSRFYITITYITIHTVRIKQA